MAKVTLLSFCVLVSLSLSSTSEVHRKNSEGNRKRTVTDPVSSFFSELGDLFLDIDRSLTIQTAPKVEYQDDLVARIFRPSNEYFSNVLKNYRDLQKRLGTLVRETIGVKSVYGERDLSTVSPPKSGDAEKTSTSTQTSGNLHERFIPFQETEVEQKNSLEPETISEENDDNGSSRDCSNEVFDNPFLDSRTREKCSQRLKRRHVASNSRKNVDGSEERFRPVDRLRLRNKLFPNTFDRNEPVNFPREFRKRGGDVVEPDSKPEGRIIGDVLYSESLFDKHIRQLLRDHGKWILDNPFLTRWRSSNRASSKDDSDITVESSSPENEVTTVGSSTDSASDMETTQVYTPSSTEYETEPPKFERSSAKNQLPFSSANYYKIVDDDGIVEEEVDIVLQPRSGLPTDNVQTVNERKEEIEAKETVILAFTTDGVPLKLRMGPEIENPIRFLHKVLKSAGVSLNVPVESYDDIEPVGKEVMKFGAGVLTRAVYLDLSDNGQLKSLLKTLMTSKATGRVKF